ncbi:MAG: DUF7192 family protein [Coriobacteriales bacterium]|jgi:hypothetical protein
MFERTRHGYLTVLHFSFSSLAEYLDYLETAPVSRAFENAQVSKQDYEEFTGSKSLEDAIAMCRYGYQDGFEEFFGLDAQIMRALDMSFDTVRTYNDYVGFAPDVKAYLEGSPLTMINRPNPPRKSISVYMNTSYDAQTEISQIFHRGAAVLTAMKVLEMLRYSVDLHLFEMSYCDMGDSTVEVHFSEFSLKNAGERTNVQKLFFPLCHPSWIRRLNFRLIETTPDISYQWAGTYGYPCSLHLMRKVLDLDETSCVLVPSFDDLGVTGTDIVEDARKVFAVFNKVLPERDRLTLRAPIARGA